MIKYIINMDGLYDKTKFYKKMKDSLPLPEYCGNNLDALHDAMTDICTDIEITFINFKNFAEEMPEYSEAFRNMLEDLNSRNRNVDIIVR